MTRIPTKDDWLTNPGESLEAALELAKVTGAHGDVSTQTVALGIAARVVAAAAPVVGSAVGGPWGALAGAAVSQVAASLEQSQRNALASLPPEQLALIEQAIAIGVAAALKKANP